ncbi:MAG: hypothetical protein EBV03_09160 [Proteobacteria bacterium]|nr:hypothetical protein [Pseudomonadota bacterium]
MRLIGLCYQSEHSALLFATLEYCHQLQQQGHQADLIDLSRPEGPPALLDRLKADPPDACFGLQGVGSRLSVEGKNLWTLSRVPFVGIHYDNPCYNVYNHFNDSPFVANLYAYQSFLGIQQAYLKPLALQQLGACFRYSVLPLPEAPMPWSERPIKLLFMKSGASLDACVAAINGLPVKLRDGIWDMLPVAERDVNLAVPDLLQRILDHYGESRAQHFDLFWGAAHWVDLYLRRKRAIAMVEWLKHQPGALIIGNGWDSIDKSTAKAEFRPGQSADQALALYGQSRFVCNVTPQGADIVHERPVFALYFGCVAITDRNRWWQDNFGADPHITLFEPYGDLDAQLQPVLDDPAMAAIAADNRAFAFQHFNNSDKTAQLTALVESMRRAA